MFNRCGDWRELGGGVWWAVRGRCEEAACGRFVRTGDRRCARHRELDDEAGAPAPRFWQRLDAASYQALLGEALRAVLTQAAADRSLGDEIGALRVTLARLLVEEDDVAKLATNVARVARVAVQAAQVRATIGTELADDLAADLARTLEELGKG